MVVQLDDSRSGDCSIRSARSRWTLRLVPRRCRATSDRTQTARVHARPTVHDRRRTRTPVHRRTLSIKDKMGVHVAEFFSCADCSWRLPPRPRVEARSTSQPRALYLRQYHSGPRLERLPCISRPAYGPVSCSDRLLSLCQWVLLRGARAATPIWPRSSDGCSGREK